MLKGRKIGALVTDGADGDRVKALRDALDRRERSSDRCAKDWRR